MWQLARVVNNRPNAGKLLWVRGTPYTTEYISEGKNKIGPCFEVNCEPVNSGVAQQEDTELLPVFSEYVRRINYHRWKEMSNEEIEALADGNNH